jgi:uncharacterized protein YecT (DUF1311 family)
MTRVILATVIALCAATSTDGGNAQSQLEMNQAAARELQTVEADMNAVLERLFKLATSRPSSVAKLKQAQVAWLAYRDAHIRAFWPSEEPGAYGSVHPMCVANERARLTRARLAELRAMTERVEGDVCACQWPD